MQKKCKLYQIQQKKQWQISNINHLLDMYIFWILFGGCFFLKRLICENVGVHFGIIPVRTSGEYISGKHPPQYFEAMSQIE